LIGMTRAGMKSDPSRAPAAGRWADRKAPSLDDFEALAAVAYAGLPETLRALCGEIVIRVADFPEDEVLRDMGLQSPYDLLGLFQGVGLAHGGTLQSGEMPNMIWLYRRPLLDYWAEYDESLGHLVTHVLVHEIGHHFGLSDEDMEALEAAADP
jgi:predicted Zn-dependent protease with MMP-like domain